MRTDTPAWEATVTARTHVTPHMVRLTLGDIRSLGEGAFTSSGRADEFPGLWFQDGEGRVTKRYYSLRDVRADSRAVTIDFVVHGHGPGTEFGERARRGDLVRFDAPRGHYAPPADTTGILIAGDATALPAIGRILDERADGPRATVVVTVEGEEDKQALRVLPGDDLRWVQPNDMLATTLAAIDATGPSDYVWFSGEAADMRAVRKRLRHGLGRPVERWATMGYWRRDEERWVRAVLGHATLPAELEEIYSTETDTEVQRDLADALLERYGL